MQSPPGKVYASSTLHCTMLSVDEFGSFLESVQQEHEESLLQQGIDSQQTDSPRTPDRSPVSETELSCSGYDTSGTSSPETPTGSLFDVPGVRRRVDDDQ